MCSSAVSFPLASEDMPLSTTLAHQYSLNYEFSGIHMKDQEAIGSGYSLRHFSFRGQREGEAQGQRNGFRALCVWLSEVREQWE